MSDNRTWSDDPDGRLVTLHHGHAPTSLSHDDVTSVCPHVTPPSVPHVQHRKRGRPRNPSPCVSDEFGPPEEHGMETVERSKTWYYRSAPDPPLPVTVPDSQRYRTRSTRNASTPLDIFLHAWDRDVVGRIIAATEHRVRERARQSTMIAERDISDLHSPPRKRARWHITLTYQLLTRYWGVRILMGKVAIANAKLYWQGSISGDCEVAIILNGIRNAMSYYTYMYIRRTICCSDLGYDETTQQGTQVDWLIEGVFGRLRGLYHGDGNLTFDDQSCRFHGKCRHKQGHRGSRQGKADHSAIPFDSLNSTDGFTYLLRVRKRADEGKPTQRPHSPNEHTHSHHQQPPMTRTTAMIVDMLKACFTKTEGLSLTTDSEYTSYKLLAQMLKLGVRVTGTVKRNWVASHTRINAKVLEKGM